MSLSEEEIDTIEEYLIHKSDPDNLSMKSLSSESEEGSFEKEYSDAQRLHQAAVTIQGATRMLDDTLRQALMIIQGVNHVLDSVTNPNRKPKLLQAGHFRVVIDGVSVIFKEETFQTLTFHWGLAETIEPSKYADAMAGDLFITMVPPAAFWFEDGSWKKWDLDSPVHHPQESRFLLEISVMGPRWYSDDGEATDFEPDYKGYILNYSHYWKKKFSKLVIP
ncbi:hypothetical protein CPB83DRAFT_845084 [Crepidotus variabilis]|uniref:Uncharacterized protein n=1 Tax=Crepidotus variabilis TaxID=179855 RepID=A0A9P6JVK8_9AGAR|nr:hypothetical protein CPB83DRAFT_845084 [Crepidotus variabilis]